MVMVVVVFFVVSLQRDKKYSPKKMVPNVRPYKTHRVFRV